MVSVLICRQKHCVRINSKQAVRLSLNVTGILDYLVIKVLVVLILNKIQLRGENSLLISITVDVLKQIMQLTPNTAVLKIHASQLLFSGEL